ncbi:MAG: hypothetical protein GWN58_02530 [Anaerolineae bacterium]|nr:hypothetical protein [Anaerolineae bacterium]
MSSSKKPTYTQALADVHDCLRQIANEIAQGKPAGDGGIQVMLAQQDRRQEEILKLLREVNGRVRKHGETLSAHDQWMADHVAETHTTLRRDVELTMKRVGIITAVDTVVAFLASAFGLSRFAQ